MGQPGFANVLEGPRVEPRGHAAVMDVGGRPLGEEVGAERARVRERAKARGEVGAVLERLELRRLHSDLIYCFKT